MTSQSLPATIPFVESLSKNNVTLARDKINTLQVNIGKLCNQACHHCHVEAGPNRTENMTNETVDVLLGLIQKSNSIKTVDITGGAPELNKNFRYFVEQLTLMGMQVIDRCNLTVLFEKGQEDLDLFLQKHKVQIIASLPCYSSSNVDKQRGKGVFGKSIDALQRFNSLGYGKENTDLLLNLVYNPVDDSLPPNQNILENSYKEKLKKDFDITFNNLFTITNMPIKRFAHMLTREGKINDYMQLLIDNFNIHAANNVMCKALVSIGYDGSIYDCDFNQMLELPVLNKNKSIFDLKSFDDLYGIINIENHCYGCTSGSGSSCGGSLV